MQASEPKLEATLSDNTVQLGEQVELEIKITDASNITPPEKIKIDGLQVGGFSQSTQRSMNYNNGHLSSSETMTFTYPIIPQKTGTFTIPPFSLQANGKTLTTPTLQLTVTGNASAARAKSSGAAGSGADSDEAEPSAEIAKAELIVPKQSAYLGEAIPVELRFYFNAQVQVQLQQGAETPQLKLDGFTMQKLSAPQQKQLEKDGHPYICLMFKTIVTPAKTGKLQLGPLELPFIAMVPVKRKAPRARRATPFDILNDPMFNGMMAMAEPRQLTVKSNPVELEVKQLPAEGKPQSFTGAVGVFKMETSASPLKVNLGDPLTMKMQISGRGNFDRVNAPQLLDGEGWKSYAPNGKFTPDDNAGISGVKAFEMAVIPQEQKSTLPVVEFSYFDPGKEKYVTLKSEATPITILGQPPQMAAAAQSPAQQAAPSPTPATKTKADDLFYISDTAHWGASFEPIYTKRSFWLAQIIPALALLAFIGFKIRAARRNNAQANRLAALQKEKTWLWKKMNQPDVGYNDFFEFAMNYLQLETARTTGREPASISANDAITSRPLDAGMAGAVQSIFDCCDEQRYTGNSIRTGTIPESKRAPVLETLKSYESL